MTTKKINYRWIGKQLRHKRWGRYRYVRDGGRWQVEKFGVDDWLDKFFDDVLYCYRRLAWNSFSSHETKEEAVANILDFRSSAIIKWTQHQRKKRNYKKRQWKYIP